MQEAVRRKARAQPPDQFVGERALGRADRRGVPFRAFEIVDRDEGRLAAHGQPHVLRHEIAIDRVAQRIELLPGIVRERPRDPRRFVDARRPASRSRNSIFGRLDRAGDRRRRVIMRGRRRAGCAPRRTAGPRWHRGRSSRRPAYRFRPRHAGRRNPCRCPCGPSSGSTSAFSWIR